MKERATKKIVIVDDNELYRQSLKRLLVDFDIIGEAENGAEVLPLIQTTNPDLLILDLSIPRISGILIARHLKESYPHLRILVLSLHDSEEHIQAAIHAGVSGYCLKDEKRADIFFAINTVLNGVDYFSPRIMNRVENAF